MISVGNILCVFNIGMRSQFNVRYIYYFWDHTTLVRFARNMAQCLNIPSRNMVIVINSIFIVLGLSLGLCSCCILIDKAYLKSCLEQNGGYWDLCGIILDSIIGDYLFLFNVQFNKI